jgi:phenylpyruvate tautomerase PptA (4-oxalocrotonate tautomerase family)
MAAVFAQYGWRGEVVPIVRVSWWAGRQQEDKQVLARAITAAMSELGIPVAATQVVFEDVSKEDWFIGGVPAAEQGRPAGQA